jgi:hypothetical protein
VLQHLVRVDEQNLEALPTSFLAKCLSEMRFPDAGWAAEQDIVLFADVVTGRQGQYLLTVDRRVELKVKGLQRLGGVQCTPAESQTQLLLRTTLDLIFQ